MIDGLRKTWRIIKRYPHVVDKKIECVELGNNYGSFGVAIDFLKEGMLVLSFGVGEDISFDKELIDKFGAKVHAFDPTPKVIEWVKAMKLQTNSFIFHPFGLAKESGKALFHLPVNENHVSGSMISYQDVQKKSIEVEMSSFEHIIELLGEQVIDLLKMDIEGSEFDVLPDIMKISRERNINIRQICLEWHGRFYKKGKRKIKQMCKLLRENGYALIYISEDGNTNSFIKEECPFE